MILYHGINTDLSEIDLKESRPDKDFGRAFIGSPDKPRGKNL